MAKTVLYPGSFDPVTNGHLDVLRQALNLAEHVVVAVGMHAGKKPLFTFEERKAMIENSIAEADFPGAQDRISQDRISQDRISIVAFSGLTVDAAREHKASFMVRGLRDGTDLDYEMQLSGMNGAMAPEVGTVFLPASPPVRPITATLVRQIAGMKGDVSSFVPQNVMAALAKKLKA